MTEINTNAPMTLICSKACEDVTKMLEEVQKQHGISSDLMTMICRDVMGHFERKRANDYCNALIANGAKIEALKQEVEALKTVNGIIEGVENDHTKA